MRSFVALILKEFAVKKLGCVESRRSRKHSEN